MLWGPRVGASSGLRVRTFEEQVTEQADPDLAASIYLAGRQEKSELTHACGLWEPTHVLISEPSPVACLTRQTRA